MPPSSCVMCVVEGASRVHSLIAMDDSAGLFMSSQRYSSFQSAPLPPPPLVAYVLCDERNSVRKIEDKETCRVSSCVSIHEMDSPKLNHARDTHHRTLVIILKALVRTFSAFNPLNN